MFSRKLLERINGSEEERLYLLCRSYCHKRPGGLGIMVEIGRMLLGIPLSSQRVSYLHTQVQWLAQDEHDSQSVVWCAPEPERLLSLRALKRMGEAAREAWMELWR